MIKTILSILLLVMCGSSNADEIAARVKNTPAGSIAATNVQTALNELDSEKQATLVSGTNIKTLNTVSLLGSGDISLPAYWTLSSTNLYAPITNSVTVGTSSTSYDQFTVNTNGTFGDGLSINYIPTGVGGIDTYNKLNLTLNNNITDTETTPKTVTNVSSSVTFSNSTDPYAGSTVYGAVFDADADQLTVPDSADFTLGTDWTIDFYVNLSSTVDKGFVGQATDGNNWWAIEKNGTTLQFRYYLAGVQTLTFHCPWSPSTSTWYHLEVSQSAVLGRKMFINGVSKTITTVASLSSNVANLSGTFDIGKITGINNAFRGTMVGFRYSAGIQRHSTNFTPPTGPYDTLSSVAIPTLILLSSGTETAKIWTDGAASDALKITVNGIDAMMFDAADGYTSIIGEDDAILYLLGDYDGGPAYRQLTLAYNSGAQYFSMGASGSNGITGFTFNEVDSEEFLSFVVADFEKVAIFPEQTTITNNTAIYIQTNSGGSSYQLVTLDAVTGNVTFGDSDGNSFSMGASSNEIYVNSTDFTITSESSINIKSNPTINFVDYVSDDSTIQFDTSDGSATFVYGNIILGAGSGAGFIEVGGGAITLDGDVGVVYSENINVNALTASKPMFTDSGKNIVSGSYDLPQIAGTGRFTAQTAAKATVATLTPAADGTYLVSANILVTTSTVHSFTVTVAYTDEGNTARTATLPFSVLAGTFVTAITNASGAVPYTGIPIQIRAKASTAITIATTGTFTTVTYNVEGRIIQL